MGFLEYTGIVVFRVGLACVLLKFKYIIRVLLRLEVMSLGIFLVISGYFLAQRGVGFLVYYLVFMVIEATLGVSLLVIIRFRYRGDYSGFMKITIC